MGSSSRHHRHHSDSKRPTSSGWKRSRSVSSSDSYSSRGHRDDRRRDDRRRDDRRRDDRRDDRHRSDRGRDARRSNRYDDDHDRRHQQNNTPRNNQPPVGFNCHLCSAFSHWTRDCPHVRLNPARFSDVDPANGCHQCGKVGHKLGNCPNQKYLCKECAGMHSSKVCPNSFVPREYHAFYSSEEDRVYYERVRPAPNKPLWSRIRGLSAVSLPHGVSKENETPEEMLQRRKQEEKLAAHKEEDSYVDDWSSYGKRCRSPTRPWISWYVQPRELDVVMWHCTACKTLQPNTVQLCVGCGSKMPVGLPAPVPASMVEKVEAAGVAAPEKKNGDAAAVEKVDDNIKSKEELTVVSGAQDVPPTKADVPVDAVPEADTRVADGDAVKA